MTTFASALKLLGIGNNTSFQKGPFLSSPCKRNKPGISQMSGFSFQNIRNVFKARKSQKGKEV